MSFIDVKNVSKTYQQKNAVPTQALKNINLSVEEGDFLCLAGTSGSGKSTLLNLLGGLDHPTEGQIFYEEKEISNVPIERLADFRLKTISFVFQAYNLINTLTALENAEYLLLLQGIGPKERRKRASEMLEQVGLADCLHKTVNRLSGGQQQRVAVCRAVVAKPRVILADEPTANLDSKTSEQLMDLMVGLNQEKNITFIFSSHDNLVIEKARKVVHMKDGEITS
ncbi:MAG: ABC transporter ATP-binding protein [Candidatus Omnitrophica bacterium]|nr:ABC transporter ATP-binding protein [Candidatus Omnitrophota bacterium]